MPEATAELVTVAPDLRLESLLHPRHLFTAEEVQARPPPIPKLPGVYAWYFDEAPPGAPTDGCHTFNGFTLLYVGIAPKAPPMNGRKASATHLQQRVSYHFKGNAEGSTLRLTLGCLLADRLGIQLQRVGNGKTRTFTNPGEQRLDAWMADHARVVWVATDQPWQLEEKLIGDLSLPLNVAGNGRHPFSRELATIRGRAKRNADSLPVVVGRGGPRMTTLDMVALRSNRLFSTKALGDSSDEWRVFKRPDGGVTLAQYPHAQTPDAEPKDKQGFGPADLQNAKLIVKIATGQDLDDYI